MNRLDNIKQKLNENEMKKIAGALMKIHKIDTTINSILLWRCDTTGSALDHTKNLFWHTINSGLYRYVTRTNISFFDRSPNDQRTEHSCA